MPILAEKVNEQGFTTEEQAELDAGATDLPGSGDNSENEDRGADQTDKGQSGGSDSGKGKENRPPVSELLRERHARQDYEKKFSESERKLAEVNGKLAKMEELWSRIQNERAGSGQGQRQDQQDQQVQIPEFETDPLGHMAAKLKLAEQRLSDIDRQSAQQREQQRINQQGQEIVSWYAAQAREFVKEAPDFSDAYTYLTGMIDKELEVRGYSDPMQRAAVINYEEGRILANCKKTGQNPAKVIYNLAKFRGFSGKAAAGQQQQQQQADKLKNLAEGQRDAKTLGAGGSPGEGATSLQSLLELEGQEFDRAWDRMRKKGMLG